jgi:hypothetical protein
LSPHDGVGGEEEKYEVRPMLAVFISGGWIGADISSTVVA